MAIDYNTRQEIIAQALQEIQFAREYKQGKIQNWKINEDLYYSRKNVAVASRANVDLGQMSSFVHTLLSKIDNPLTFKFTKRKESQLKRVKYLNALRIADQQNNDWDIKDIAGKKQALIYGRAIFSYAAESPNGIYKACLDNVDVYDYLIDPSGGGIDIERAFYMGRYGVVKTRAEIKKGIKEKIYLKTEADILLQGSGNSTEMPQEEVNKQNRIADTNVWKLQREIGNPNKFKFWEWYTTYDGIRYYLLLSEEGGTAIRVVPLTELFESNLFPFWTWAAFPDLTEFWTPSYCDYVREIFMAQAVSINQLIDNAEQINKPQKLVNTMAVKNLAELKYRREGYIKVGNVTDLNQAVQNLAVPAISTPIEVFNLLDGIQEKTSGVTAGAKGVSDEDKVGVYEGNQANAADRFGFLNKSYSFGYKRFAKLFEWGVKENLVKKVAVDILGPDGVEIIEVSRRDIFRKGDDFGIMVESSNAEIALSEVEKRTKISFLNSQATNPIQNPQKAYEIQATIAGFEDDTIRQLLDTTDYGSAELMSEAERDIEALLDGEKLAPNQNATTAYKQRFVNYLKDNQEKIDFEQFTLLSEYIMTLDEVIERNMVAQANNMLFKQNMAQLTAPQPQPVANAGAVPVEEDINNNGEMPIE
jgi:hypothetical protein